MYIFNFNQSYSIFQSSFLQQKLEELEKEEQLREEAGYYAVPKIELDETLREIRSLALRIRERKAIMRQETRITKQSNKPTIPRTAPARARERSVSTLRNKMRDLGVDLENTDEVSFSPHHTHILYVRLSFIYIRAFRLISQKLVAELVLYRDRLQDLSLDQRNDLRPILKTDLLLEAKVDHLVTNPVSKMLR